MLATSASIHMETLHTCLKQGPQEGHSLAASPSGRARNNCTCYGIRNEQTFVTIGFTDGSGLIKGSATCWWDSRVDAADRWPKMTTISSITTDLCNDS
jgi:hypothetical protein